MKHWLTAAATEQGPRRENDDHVAVSTWKHKRKRYHSIVICDGIGSLAGSGTCSSRTASLATNAAKDFVSSRKSARPFGCLDESKLVDQLYGAFSDCLELKNQGTTLALVLFNDRSAIVAWAGDSRIYALMADGALNQVTSDHLDADGRIVRYVSGDGRILGGLETRLLDMKRVVALIGTTDGLHDCCSRDEFREFIVYSITGQGVGADSFKSDVIAFLGRNISDNTTIGLVYQPIALHRGTRMLRTSTQARG